MSAHLQIGEVSDRTGLSLRTIRYYGEVGLVVPSARSEGGFRLYTEDDVARLSLVQRMKPLDFTLEEMRGLLTALDRLEEEQAPAADRQAAAETLGEYRSTAAQRCAALRRRVRAAEEFLAELDAKLG